MGDLIFVPELGLLSGKSQNLKVRMWYPIPHPLKPKSRVSTRLRKKPESSPFSQTQTVNRMQTQSPRRSNHKAPSTALEAHLQPRPLTMISGKRGRFSLGRPEKFQKIEITPNSLEAAFEQRPVTRAGGKRLHFPYEPGKIDKINKINEQKSFQNSLEVSLQKRPLTMAGGQRARLSEDVINAFDDEEPLTLPGLQQRPNRNF